MNCPAARGRPCPPSPALLRRQIRPARPRRRPRRPARTDDSPPSGHPPVRRAGRGGRPAVPRVSGHFALCGEGRPRAAVLVVADPAAGAGQLADLGRGPPAAELTAGSGAPVGRNLIFVTSTVGAIARHRRSATRNPCAPVSEEAGHCILHWPGPLGSVGVEAPRRGLPAAKGIAAGAPPGLRLRTELPAARAESPSLCPVSPPCWASP